MLIVMRDKMPKMPQQTQDKKSGFFSKLGNTVLNAIPWRTTITAITTLVLGPIGGLIAGGVLYGNYRRNNVHSQQNDERTKSNNAKESQQPGVFKKSFFRAAALAVGVSFFPIGIAIAGALIVADAISNGKLIQATDKIVDTAYDVSRGFVEGISHLGKAVYSKIMDTQKASKNDIEKPRPEYSIDDKNSPLQSANNSFNDNPSLLNKISSNSAEKIKEKDQENSSKEVHGTHTQKLAESRNNNQSQSVLK